MGSTLLGKKTNYTAPLNVLNDLAQDKVIMLPHAKKLIATKT